MTRLTGEALGCGIIALLLGACTAEHVGPPGPDTVQTRRVTRSQAGGSLVEDG
jgi:hypothetical protein